jgi:hypothetical protein
LLHFFALRQIRKNFVFGLLHVASNLKRTVPLLCLCCVGVGEAFISRFNKFALNSIEIDLVQAETEGQDLKEKIGTH